jgi:hypothetical protein
MSDLIKAEIKKLEDRRFQAMMANSGCSTAVTPTSG